MENFNFDFNGLSVFAMNLGFTLFWWAIFVLFLVGTGYLFLLWWRNRDREQKSLNYVLLSVAVPKGNEIKIDAAEQMFASFSSFGKHGFLKFLKPDEHISFEIAALKEDIRFYVSVPLKLRDLVEKQIHANYAGAEVVASPEYNIFTETGKVVFASLRLKGANYMPIKTFKDLPVDPLNSLTTNLGKMGDGEGASVQVLFAPTDHKWASQGKHYISKIKKQEANPETSKYATDPKTLEAVDNKCNKPGFITTVRVVVCSETEQSAKAHLQNILSSFEQFNGDMNGFKKNRHLIKKLFLIDYIYRYFPVFGKTSVLSSEELATIIHFPNRTVETPHINWVNAKRAPASQAIPKSGLFLGYNVYRGVRKPIYISPDDRQRHVYIIGKTGTGKSELLKEMILQDIRAGRGVCFIDPHDTVEKILECIPPERAEDVIYFDPANADRPMGLNMIEAKTEQQKHFVVNSIIGLMYKLYDPHQTGIIGPRFEHAIRNAMLTVMSEEGATFIEVVRCLTDANYVQQLLPKVTDPLVRRYWTDQIAQTSDFHKSEVLDYIVSKFGRFITNKLMRNIIGQSKSAFDFREAMDTGKIVLINLSKGRIGEENSSFLGLILVPRILMAAMSRQDIPEDQRRDFFVYVDEFQNFATPDFAVILSEARKYHLALTVANQFIGQMEEEVKNAVFGNVGTLISFRVGVSDAGYLQHEYQPTFNETDLINVEKYNAYVKTIVSNEPQIPFSLDLKKDMTQVTGQQNAEAGQMIKRLSALKYGKDANIIEAEMTTRAKL
jgi:hypothetical protein